MSYTYYLYHTPTNKHYYGARYAKNAHVGDLWNTYFTSSKRIHNLIEEYSAATRKKISESNMGKTSLDGYGDYT